MLRYSIKQKSRGHLTLSGTLAIALALSAGCQAWTSSPLPVGLNTKSERKVMRQAKQDPFPSPKDVGIEADH